MSTARLQYLTDEEEEDDNEEGEEEGSYKPKISITISKSRSQLKRPVCFSDQVTPRALHLNVHSTTGRCHDGGGDAGQRAGEAVCQECHL